MKLALALTLLLPASAAAQETLVYDKDGIHFEVPKGDNHNLITENFNWKKDWDKDGAQTQAEWWMGDPIGGRLIRYNYAGTAKDYIDWRLKSWLDMFSGSWEVGRRAMGDGWFLECAVKTKDQTFRYVHLAWGNGKVMYDLMMWAVNETFASHRDKAMGILSSARFGGGGGTTPSTSGGGKGIKVPKHAWKGFGKGTSATYKLVSEFSGAKTEMTMTFELVESADTAYTIKTITEMMGTKQESVQIYEVDPKAGEGGGNTTSGSQPKVEKGKESIEVPAGKFDCEWIQTESSGTTSKSWTSDKVPGGIVKSVTKMAAGTSTMELVQLTAK